LRIVEGKLVAKRRLRIAMAGTSGGDSRSLEEVTTMRKG
jgi:hypothetical protein